MIPVKVFVLIMLCSIVAFCLCLLALNNSVHFVSRFVSWWSKRHRWSQSAYDLPVTLRRISRERFKVWVSAFQ